MKRKDAGFTLLEVMIGFAIIVFVAATVFQVQASSLFYSVHTRNLLVATNLARSFIAESELELEKKDFGELDKEDDGAFKKPFAEFKWRREIEEVDFSSLSRIIEAAQVGSDDTDNQNQQDGRTLIINTFETYLQDSIRRMTITIEWQEDGEKAELSFSTFLVRYNAELKTAI